MSSNNEGIPRATKEEALAIYSDRLTAYERIASGMSQLFRVVITEDKTGRFVARHDVMTDINADLSTLDPKASEEEENWRELGMSRTATIISATEIIPEIEATKARIAMLSA